MAEYKGFYANSALVQTLLQKATQPKGFASNEVEGFAVSYVSTHCCYLADKANPRMLYRAKLSHRSCRWFDTPERAYAYQVEHRKPGSNSIAYKPPSKRQCNFADSDTAVITAKTKFTPAAPIPERFPDDGKRGSHLSQRPIGEYDMPASRWVEAVA